MTVFYPLSSYAIAAGLFPVIPDVALQTEESDPSLVPPDINDVAMFAQQSHHRSQYQNR